jgi:hypothetical protein
MAVRASAQHIFPLLFVKQEGEDRNKMDSERPTRKKKGRGLSPSNFYSYFLGREYSTLQQF